jgi:phage-related protein
MKQVAFHGDALDEIRTFPVEARRQVGFQIERLQNGLNPNDWKPMKTIGPGVREIRVRDAAGAFRVIYLATFADQVHVLHAFVKKSQATSRGDIEIATLRFRELMRGVRR